MQGDPNITFVFDEHAGLYWPGDTLSGEVYVDAPVPGDVKAIEISVLWYTLGKGDEDLTVHYFERKTFEHAGRDTREPLPFATALPNSPLSYDGRLVKIVWCLRVRAFLRRGREVVDEQPFQLGAVPRPHLQATSRE